jgi:hypothetical protein
MRSANRSDSNVRKSSDGRLRKSGDATVLQHEAANAVNEAEDEPMVTNEEKYEQLLESRKFRRAVRQI